jgi:hypothetical protein
MPFDLDDIAPRGWTLAEYCTMFDLGDAERRLSILGCGDGPSSFNAEGTAQNMRIVSVDPLYALRAPDIRARCAATTDVAGSHDTALAQFLADYELGVDQGRYVTGGADDLPFPDGSYDLALCPHLLFVHGARHPLALHLKAIRELMRVAEELRIFPLQEAGGVESRHLKAVMLGVPRLGYRCERLPAGGSATPGGGEMLKISR